MNNKISPYGSSVKKMILFSILAVAVMAVMLVPAGSETDAAAPFSYVDETGATVLITTEPFVQFTAATTSLTTGNWYYVDGNVTSTTVTATGDVHIIIMDGFTLTVTAINVAASSTLSIYPGSSTATVAKTGILSSSAATVNLNAAGGQLINVSNIVGGTIGVSSTATSTIENYGKITGNGIAATQGGVYTTGANTIVNNYTGAEITGGTNGVRIAGTGNLVNSGKISGTNYGVLMNSLGDVTNNYEISSNTTGLRFETGGTLTNNGKISGSGTAATSCAVYGINYSITVNNNAGAELNGGYNGIRMDAGGSVTNRGSITATTYCIQFQGGGTANNYGVLSCTGTGAASGGFYSINLPANVNNYAGAVIKDGPNGVRFAMGGTLVNNGKITATTYGVFVAGMSGTITNTSEITGGTTGIRLEASGTVNNEGTVTGTSSYGINTVNYSADVNNSATGIVLGGLIGVNFAAGGKVENYGKITGSGTASTGGGVYAAGTVSSIVNSYTGAEIKGGVNGVYMTAGGEINNRGQITGTTYAIKLDAGGTVTNTGTISSPGAYGINASGSSLSVYNNSVTAVISGGALGMYSAVGGTVENYGIISGSGTTGIQGAVYSIANTTLNNYAGAEIRGGTNGIYLTAGGEVNSKGTITGATYGIRLDGGGTVTNEGSITGTNSAGIYAANTAITVTNKVAASQITGGLTGVSIGKGGTIENHGSITGNGTAINSQGGVYSSGAVTTVENTGAIRGGYNGIRLNDGGTITNDGTITGSNNGVYLNAGGTVTNEGIITSTTSIGIYAVNTAITVTNKVAGAEITGSLVGIEMLAGGTVNNYGKISGNTTSSVSGALYSTGIVTINNFAGAEIIGYNALKLSAGGTVNNYGKITGTGTTSAYAALYSSDVTLNINNFAGGEINGAYYGIRSTAGATIVNGGKITGVHSCQIDGVAGTVTNTGEITGNTTGISLIKGGIVYNYGVINGKGTGSVTNAGVNMSAAGDVYNYAGAEINGGFTGVYLANGGTLSNDALITGSTAVYTSGPTYTFTITNSVNGEIKGGTKGIELRAGTGTLENSGKISGNGTGATEGGVFIYQAVSVINNFAGAEIKGGTNGIRADVGATVNNEGIITGTVDGINGSASTAKITLTNTNIINGNVALGTAANEVTFTVGSKIDGNFDISSSAAGTTLSFTDPKDSLGAGYIYVTVTGATKIGTARVDVSFTTLPVPYNGRDIVLIDGSGGSVTGSPANGTFFVDPHQFNIKTKVGNQLVATLSDDFVVVTLESVPAGADFYYTITTAFGATLEETPYTTPFGVGVEELFSFRAGHLTGADFLRWLDEAGGLVTIADTVVSITDLTPYLVDKTASFTALYQPKDDGTDSGNSQVVLVTLKSNPDGAELRYTFTDRLGNTFADLLYTEPFNIGLDEVLTIRTGDIAGFYFFKWRDDEGYIVSEDPETSALDLFQYIDDYTVTFIAEFNKITTHITYTITATADPGATITPSGAREVPRGANQTFVFTAKEGYTIVEVRIDNIFYLTEAEIAKGQYTFYNVMADHTIHVRTMNGAKTDLTLRIDIIKGEGYAQYSVGNGFITYTGVVSIPSGTNLIVRAHPADGFKFDRWEIPGKEITPTLKFNNLRSSLQLDLFFAIEDAGPDDSASLWWIVILVIIIFVLLLFFLLWYRTGLFITIVMNGKPVEGAAITFSMNKDGKISKGIEQTDKRGKFKIPAKKDHYVMITMAAKDGHIATGLPLQVIMEKRKEFRELKLK